MDSYNSQIFEMNNDILYYDSIKSILLCKFALNNKNRWAKKIHDINSINGIIEDTKNFYVSCESNDITGQYLALNKRDGKTEWFIPGKAFFHILFNSSLYAIFADEKVSYYLLKLDKSDGKKIWYHQVGPELCEYSFKKNRILLTYTSGKIEKISPETGFMIKG